MKSPSKQFSNELVNQWNYLSQNPEENISQLTALSNQISSLKEEIEKEQKAFIADWEIILGKQKSESPNVELPLSANQ